MGHALEIVTNSSEVLKIAASLWDDFPVLSDGSPVKLKIEVSAHDSGVSPAAPAPWYAGHLMSIVETRRNFAIADMTAGIGVMRMTRDTVENAPWFVYHYLEPIAYALLGARHFTMLHASSVAIGGKAAVLCGEAGAGKTCLAYACATRGWSFLSGDATHLLRDSAEVTVIGRPFSIRFRDSARMVFPQLRDHPARMRPNGKCDLELDPRELDLPIAVEAPAGLVVLINRASARAGACAEPVPRDQARTLLSRWIRLGDPESKAAQRRALERLLEKPLMRLTYSDPFDAERVLFKELVR